VGREPLPCHRAPPSREARCLVPRACARATGRRRQARLARCTRRRCRAEGRPAPRSSPRPARSPSAVASGALRGAR
jgi:hypothetical protein